MKYSVAILIIASSFTSCKTQQNDNTTQQKTPENRQDRPQQSNGKQGPPSISEIFKMDTNGDGLLSKTEVKGRLLNDFDKIDTNNDGLLSKTEVQNAPKPQRGQGGPPRN